MVKHVSSSLDKDSFKKKPSSCISLFFVQPANPVSFAFFTFNPRDSLDTYNQDFMVVLWCRKARLHAATNNKRK